MLLGIIVLLASSAMAETDLSDLRTGAVKIYGNQHIKTDIIRREIPFAPGDPFDPVELDRARARIRRLPGIDHSDVAVYLSPTDSSLVVSVSVTEKSAIEGKIRLERNLENDIGAGLSMTDHNFRGRSEKLWTSFLLRGGQQYELGWENPWIAATQRRVGVGAQGFFEDYDYVYHDAGDAVAGQGLQRIGGRLSAFVTHGGPSRLFVAGGFESVKGEVAGMTVNDGRDNYAVLSTGAILDRRGESRFPWKGIYLKAVARQLGPGDPNFNIFEGVADARAYLPVFNRVVLAGHTALTYRDGDHIPLYRREHLGGSKTLRGYEFGSFHGDNALAGNVELRIPVNFSRADPMEYMLLGIELHLFADTGAAWDRGVDVTGDTFHTSYGAGFSVMNRNFAPLRFDWGWHDNSSARFEFDFGLDF